MLYTEDSGWVWYTCCFHLCLFFPFCFVFGVFRHPFKGAQSLFFSKFSFLFHFKESSLQSYKFKIWVKPVKPFGCTKQFCVFQLPTFYCVSLITVTITRHVFINIFQTEYYFSCKIWHRFWEKYELSSDTKISKSWKNRTGLL